jgi:hypothetical protein
MMNLSQFSLSTTRRQPVRLATALVLAAALAVTPAATATAASSASTAPVITDDQAAALQTWMAQYGVDLSTRNALIEELKAGHRWDSSLGLEPVSVSDSFNAEGIGHSISTFADGSIKVSSVGENVSPTASLVSKANRVGASTAASGGAVIQSVGGCILTQASGINKYTDCKVEDSTGVITARFYATVWRRNNTYSSIEKVSRGEIYVFLGTWNSKVGPKVIRKNSSGTSIPAVARMEWTAVTGIGTFSQYEELQVKRAGAMQSFGGL